MLDNEQQRDRSKKIRRLRRRERYRLARWRFAAKHNRKSAAKWLRLYLAARSYRRRLKVRGDCLSPAGLDFIKSFEGFRGRAYKDIVGVWTIGYGHTHGVHKNDRITRSQAEDLLVQEIHAHYLPSIARLPNKIVLTQHQIDALASFVFNVGVGGISEGTRVGRHLRQIKLPFDYEATLAADALLQWNRANGRPNSGLTRRRAAERAMFLTRSRRWS